MKVIFDSGASASIFCTDIVHKQHKVPKQKKKTYYYDRNFQHKIYCRHGIKIPGVTSYRSNCHKT